MEVEKNYEVDKSVPHHFDYSDDDEEDSLFPGCDMAPRQPSRAPTPEPAPLDVELKRLNVVCYYGPLSPQFTLSTMGMDIDLFEDSPRTPSPIAPLVLCHAQLPLSPGVLTTDEVLTNMDD